MTLAEPGMLKVIFYFTEPVAVAGSLISPPALGVVACIEAYLLNPNDNPDGKRWDPL